MCFADTLGMYTIVEGVRLAVEENEVFTVENRFSDSSQFECLGHIGSDVTDLYWTIGRDGESPIIPDSSFDNDYYNVFVGDNYLTLTIKHSMAAFRGFVRCTSRTAPQNITVFIQGSACVATSSKEVPNACIVYSL